MLGALILMRVDGVAGSLCKGDSRAFLLSWIQHKIVRDAHFILRVPFSERQSEEKMRGKGLCQRPLSVILCDFSMFGKS